MAAASAPSVTARNADELRAAALLTLKSKRKRPEGPETPTLPDPASRPAVAQSQDSVVVDLNYDDEPKPAPTQSLPTPPPTAVTAPGLSDSAVDEDVDMAEREEGEISDSDEQAAAQVENISLINRLSLPGPPGPATNMNGGQPISSDRRGDLVPHPALAASLLLPPTSPTLSRSTAAVSSPAERDLRPKLKIQPEELHEIKLHILDLLGMGVPPEYLVDYGLDRETIAYAFHELNLRLPYNLNLKQEDALYPKPMNERVTIPTAPATPASAPTSTSASRKPSISTPLAQRFPPPHAGLPPKPATTAVLLADSSRASIIAQPARANAPALATLPPPVPSTSKAAPVPPSPGRPDLQEMESQRKQELKARKAVLESLRSKKVGPPVAANPIPHSAAANTPRIATVAQTGGTTSDPVADFLRSIPVSSAAAPTLAAPLLTRSPEAMDVDLDEERDNNPSSSTPILKPASVPQRQPSNPSPTTSTAEQNGHGTLRGVKRSRPVAADFNDEAGYSSSSSLGSSNNGAPPAKRPVPGNNGKKASTHVPYLPPSIRKHSSFAGLHNSWQTSHVINVSDSEDDDDGQDPQLLPLGLTAASTAKDPALPPGRPLTVLERQELEIRQMKQRIAAAEQKKLQKLKPATATTTPVELKQEYLTPTLAEADVVMTEQLAPSADFGIPGLSTSLDHLPRLLQQAAAALARAPTLATDAARLSTPKPSSATVGIELSRSRSLSQPVPTPSTPAVVPESRSAEPAAGPPQGAATAVSSAPESGDSDDDLYGDARGFGPRKDGSSSRSSEGEDGTKRQDPQGDDMELDGARILPGQALTQADDVLGGPRDGTVGVTASEDKQPAAEEEEEEGRAGSFVAYESVLRRYPSLDAFVDGGGGSRLQVRAVPAMAANPHGKICPYEVPGGGVCRDATCTDLHLRAL